MFSKVEGQLKDFTVVRSTKLMLKQHFIIQTSQREYSLRGGSFQFSA